MQLVRNRFLVRSEVHPHLHLDFRLRIILPLISIHRLGTPTAGEGNPWLLFSRIRWFEGSNHQRKTHSGHSPPSNSYSAAFKTSGLLLTGPSNGGAREFRGRMTRRKSHFFTWMAVRKRASILTQETTAPNRESAQLSVKSHMGLGIFPSHLCAK